MWLWSSVEFVNGIAAQSGRASTSMAAAAVVVSTVTRVGIEVSGLREAAWARLCWLYEHPMTRRSDSGGQ